MGIWLARSAKKTKFSGDSYSWGENMVDLMVNNKAPTQIVE